MSEYEGALFGAATVKHDDHIEARVYIYKSPVWGIMLRVPNDPNRGPAENDLMALRKVIDGCVDDLLDLKRQIEDTHKAGWNYAGD